MDNDLADRIYTKDDLESGNLGSVSCLSLWRFCLKYGCRRMFSILGVLPKRIFRAASAILPSYLGSCNTGWQGLELSPEPQATSALDGLRGFACCAVFVYHSVTPYSHTFLYGYGGTEDRHFYQLPFLHLHFSGPTMVSVFFVISGCVLSYKPSKLIGTKSWGQLLRVLSSSVF